MMGKIFNNIIVITLLIAAIPNVALASSDLPWGRFVPGLILIPIVWIVVRLTSKSDGERKDK